MTIGNRTQVGRYKILSLLGAGGMGEVFLAHDTKLNRNVAIKFLPPESVANEQAKRRFQREAKAAASLDHPNICGIFEVGEENGHSFICMQYVEGETLEHRVKRKSCDLSESLSIAIQVADGLAEAHAHGIIHRDMKPSNIMITTRGAVKIMDFGLAKQSQRAGVFSSEAETEALISAPGAIIGTLPYMSPEQVRGEPTDARSDIFSFGVVLYEMVTGLQPFATKSSAATASAILTSEPAPLARFCRDVPRELERIVEKTLRKDAEERYQTAKDLLIDLRTLKDEIDFQHRLERSSPPSARRDDSIGQPITKIQVPYADTAPALEKTTEAKLKTTAPGLQRRFVGRAGLIVSMVVLMLIAAWYLWHRSNIKWAKAQVPQIEALAQQQKYFEAYALAIDAQTYLVDDPTISRLLPTISELISVETDPPDAEVYLKRFAPDPAGRFPPRQLIGTTPLKDLRVSRGEYVLDIEKAGYTEVEQPTSVYAQPTNPNPPSSIVIKERLLQTGKIPDRMVSVPGGDYRLVGWARPTDERVQLDDFFVDKYEVSNQEFKEFINAGGYLKKQYWKYPFVKDGKSLSWDEALKEFLDHSGLPGPRSWSNQNFPEGKADYPVTDITWYEAAAFAAFKDKQLPTVFQWEKAARDGGSSIFHPFMPWGPLYPGATLDYHANFKTDGTMPVNSSEFGISRFGAYNMAGNVREWLLNDTSEGFMAGGGAWGDPSYSFASYSRFPTFYTSNKLGFRCVINTEGAKGDQGGERIEIKEEIPTYTASSEANFKEWLKSYRYEKAPLDAQISETTENESWRREKINFIGADGERAIAYLYLPKNFGRPLQVIHFVPASDVENGVLPLTASIEGRLAALIKSGRAVFGVVLKGYSERVRPPGYIEPDPRTVEYRDKVVNWITDLRRGLDYLETRKDIDTSRIAFFGPSAGARIGLILAAVEDRYRSVFFLGVGYRKQYVPWIAEANPINFAPHIRAPKLVMHGRYDENLSLKIEAEPLFKVLSEPKRVVIFEGGHIPTPYESVITTLNGWLNETLGPVKRE